MKCINKSHPEYISLLENNPYPVPLLDAKISIWQDQNNTDEFPTLDQLAQPVGDSKIRYEFKATAAIINKLDKIKEWHKSLGDTDKFWNKLQQDLQIPKEQIVLLKESEGNTIEEKLLDFTTKYSQVIEINTTKEQGLKNQKKGFDLTQVPDTGRWVVSNFQTGIPKYFDIKEDAEKYIKGEVEETPTQHYSNLTVPGGTNYTENEISTPDITPSIKGHAQFSTDNGIGWFRSDEQTIDELKGNWIKSESELPNEFVYNGERYFKEGGEWQTKSKFIEDIQTVIWRYNMSLGNERIQNKPEAKTRRILEVQSDIFQKSRDIKSAEDIYAEMKKSGELIVDCG